MTARTAAALNARQMLAKLVEPETIESMFDDWYDELADGLYIKPYDKLDAHARAEYKMAEGSDGTEEYRTLHWTPAGETRPALPFPFSSRQLAAFVLFGQGADIADRWSVEEVSERIALDGQKVHPAFHLMRDAHEWLLEAEKRFPTPEVDNRKVFDWKTVDTQALWLLNAAGGEDLGFVRASAVPATTHRLIVGQQGKAQGAPQADATFNWGFVAELLKHTPGHRARLLLEHMRGVEAKLGGEMPTFIKVAGRNFQVSEDLLQRLELLPDIDAALIDLTNPKLSDADPMVAALGQARPDEVESMAVVAFAKMHAAALPTDPLMRRAQLLDWFRDEGGKRPQEGGKKGTRGALARVARKSGVDKDTLGALLDKAIGEKKGADAFAGLFAKR